MFWIEQDTKKSVEKKGAPETGRSQVTEKQPTVLEDKSCAVDSTNDGAKGGTMQKKQAKPRTKAAGKKASKAGGESIPATGGDTVSCSISREADPNKGPEQKLVDDFACIPPTVKKAKRS